MAASERGCCVPKCGRTRKDDTVLHSFPNPHKEMYRYHAWVQAIGIETTLDPHYVYRNRRVCHLHFDTIFLTWSRRLSPDAIPTLLVPDTPESKRKKLIPYKDHSYSRDEDLIDPMPGEDDAMPVEHDAMPVEVDQLQVSSPLKEVFRHIKPKPTSGPLHFPSDTPPAADDNTSIAIEDHLEDDTSADDTVPVQFSWQNSEHITLDEDCDPIFGDGPSTLEMIVENRFSEDGEADKNIIKNEKHTEYFCDNCTKEIIGFRYTCVQCDNFDLCCACEGTLLHPHHYMLRVPGQKPFSEVNSILEAVREKIKLLTEEAQKHSAGLEIEEIKLEEPQFEEVTVDPFSEVTIPPLADDHTSQLHVHTSENKSDTTHTNTSASDRHKELKKEHSKAPVKIVMPKDVFFKAFKMNTVGEPTSVPHVKTYKKNFTPNILRKTRSAVAPHLLNCYVELTRVPKTYRQAKRSLGSVSHNSGSETTGKQKSSEVINLDTEAQEYVVENRLKGEMETIRHQKPISVVEQNRDEDTQAEEYVDEMWLDDTLLELESQNLTSN